MGPPGEGLVFMALYGPQMVTWSFGVRLYTLAILTQFCVVKPEAFVDFSRSSDRGRACTVPPGAPGFILAGAKGAAPQSGSRNMKACCRAGARGPGCWADSRSSGRGDRQTVLACKKTQIGHFLDVYLFCIYIYFGEGDGSPLQHSCLDTHTYRRRQHY